METEDIASSFNLIGGLIYLSPDDESLKPVYRFFQQPEWFYQWPCGDLEELKKINKLIGKNPIKPESLLEVHNALFIKGEIVSPWASAYLNGEGRAFGASIMKLRSFLEEQGLSLKRHADEPEDHIGLLLLTGAWLAVAKREKALTFLLKDFILPWISMYCKLSKSLSPNSFYQGIADLLLLTCLEIQKDRQLDVTPLALYH